MLAKLDSSFVLGFRWDSSFSYDSYDSYDFNLTEGSSRGDHIGQIELKEGNSSYVSSVFLITDPYNLVDLDSGNGVLKLRRAIDDVAESTGKFDFCTETFVVSLSIVPKLVRLVSVGIHVLRDNNTVSHEFSSKPCMMSVWEDAAIGALVLRVSACFRYPGQAESTTYTLISGNNNGTFSMNTSDGTITVNASLDYEKQTAYNLSVLVQDQFNQSQQPRTIQINVRVLDVNDNSPVFETTEYSFQVNENTSVSTVLFVVSATDADSGANSVLRYFFTNGSDSDIFDVVPWSGAIIMTAPPDYKLQKIYSLSLSVSDLGIPQHTANAKVTIEVALMSMITFQFLAKERILERCTNCLRRALSLLLLL